jgi:hypothetical protein
MTIWRRYTRRDANEPELVAAAEALGATWQPLSIRGGPDGMIGVLGRVAFVENKVGKGKLRETQRKWHSWWKGPEVHVIRTVEDMVDLVQQLREQR